ncbi:hypothetical protein OU787_30280 [Kitasatospora sp. YST-16]|uniref:hypothetical protein n=1 Tax=Kitasatospora sp. YST-16 TaxID=2998080 RepID=UPI0022840C6B|nr:hypothetical protein [Kitasatospora sp. YST-16]WAL75443.1 hypothetical protein OU787_30280 [Kitasatospora sp. YST-16]
MTCNSGARNAGSTGGTPDADGDGDGDGVGVGPGPALGPAVGVVPGLGAGVGSGFPSVPGTSCEGTTVPGVAGPFENSAARAPPTGTVKCVETPGVAGTRAGTNDQLSTFNAEGTEASTSPSARCPPLAIPACPSTRTIATSSGTLP